MKCSHEFVPLEFGYRGCIHCRRVEMLSRGRNRMGVTRWLRIHPDFWEDYWKRKDTGDLS